MARIAKAGGVDEIRKEANLLFQEYGVTKLMFFSYDFTTNVAPHKYPALASLGQMGGIWPDRPAVIIIRVGRTHLDGYIMEIVDVNSDYSHSPGRDTIEIGKGIYIHR